MRILLVDDHPMIRTAIEALLRGTGFEIVGMAATGEDALRKVEELDPDILWQTIGLVPQRPYLFSGTIASNLRYGKPDASEEEMWEALGHAPSVANATWPVVDPLLMMAESVTCVVQVQGKVKARLQVPAAGVWTGRALLDLEGGSIRARACAGSDLEVLP